VNKCLENADAVFNIDFKSPKLIVRIEKDLVFFDCWCLEKLSSEQNP